MILHPQPLRRLLGAVLTAHPHTHSGQITRKSRELRLLQRRLAAARLGVGWPDRIRPSIYEDLR